MKRISVAFVGITLLFSLASASRAQVWAGPAGIEIEVTSKGKPVVGARVLLRYREAPKGSFAVLTDSKGRAAVVNLAPGAWNIEVSHEDYLSYVAAVTLEPGKKASETTSFLQATGSGREAIRIKYQKASGPIGTPVEAPPAAPRAADPIPAPAPRVTPPEPEPEPVELREPDIPVPTPAAPAPSPAETIESAPVEPPAELREPDIPVPSSPTAEAPAEPTSPTLPEAMEEPEPMPAEPVQRPPAQPQAPTVPPAPKRVAVPTSPPLSPPSVVDVDDVGEAPAPMLETKPEPEPPTETEMPETPEMPAPAELESEEIVPEPVMVPDEPATVTPPAAPAPPAQKTPTPEPSRPTPAVEMPEPAQTEMPPPPQAEPPIPAPAPEPQLEMPEAEPEVEMAEPETEFPATSPPAAAPAPTPAPRVPSPSLKTFSDRTCPECKPGEWSAASVEIGGALTSGDACPADARELAQQAARRVARAPLGSLKGFAGPAIGGVSPTALELIPASARNAVDEALAWSGDSCRLLAVAIPRGAKFQGFRYEAADGSGQADCVGDQDCPIGDSTFLGNPGIERGQEITVVYSVFENRSRDQERRARLTVYFVPATGWRP